MFGMISNLNVAQKLIVPTFGLGTAIQENLYKSMDEMAKPWHHYGETNRYSKEPIPLSDGPSIKKPASFESLQYERHRYSPLYRDEQAPNMGKEKPIRLLEVLPPRTTNSEVIHCKLHAYSLNQAPKFEAISYSWGVANTQDFPVVIINGTETREDTPEAVEITRHLYAALIRLRHPTQSRMLWADQICINQADKSEKSKQVQQMSDIYKQSNPTVVWLGEEDKDKDALTELFTLLINSPFISVRDDLRLLTGILSAENSRRQQAVTRLLNRTWFSRVWVFQEAIVSREVEVMYGSLKFPLGDLFRLVRVVFAVENAAGGYASSIAKRTTGYDTLYLIQHNRREGCDDADCPRKKVPYNFLGIVMQALQQLYATKELDLIYAFVGFEDAQADPRIKVDYKLPVHTVWLNATKTIIQNSSLLDIFAAVSGTEIRKYDLPSWVPDFSRCYPYARPITAPDFKTAFNASSGIPHTWENSADPEALVVKGKIIGTIMWFSPPTFDRKDHREAALGTKAVLEYENHANVMRRYLDIQNIVTPQRRQELVGDYSTLIRTLLADGAFGHEQPLPCSLDEILWVCEHEDEIQAASNSQGSPSGNRNYEVLETVREWGLIVQQKRLFLTDQYDMGLVPKAAKTGDLICLLHGSKIPCVLRRSDVGEQRYRIISQCYLDGKMYCNGSNERAAWLKDGAQEFVIV